MCEADYGPRVVNPKSLREESAEVSWWASSLKERFLGQQRPKELYRFRPQNVGIYTQRIIPYSEPNFMS